ncbi:MAG: G/U mismatch-specific DNA glycosylase [Candidatus Marinimicrobia bacterium]|nr:G/U mismatch-specific DNA glycosylase [Candidatus Neomarinimicrobiota bacterium]
MPTELPTDELLPDIIDTRMNLLFVSPAPLRSWVESGHYHDGDGDRFYRLLYEVGLTTEENAPSADTTLLNHGIGLTTLSKTKPVNDLEELEPVDFSIGRLIRIAFEFRPQIICCEGKQVFQDFFDRHGDFGFQKELIADARVFIAPASTDEQVAYENLLAYYRQLKKGLSQPQED